VSSTEAGDASLFSGKKGKKSWKRYGALSLYGAWEKNFLEDPTRDHNLKRKKSGSNPSLHFNLKERLRVIP